MTIPKTTASDRIRARLLQAAVSMAMSAALAFALPSGPVAAQVSADAPAKKSPKSAAPARQGDAAGTKSRASKKPAAQVSGTRAEVPYDCRGLDGVSRDVCVRCADVPIYKRVVCEQKAFWTLCKGKRLFTDVYCQQNQSLGRGEGGEGG